MPALDALLFAHASTQILRLCAALSVLAVLILWGRRATAALGGSDLCWPDRLLLDLGLGFGLLSAVLRLLGAIGLFRPAVVWGVAAAGALLLAPRREILRPDLGRARWRLGAVESLLLLLLLLPLPLALAPAVSWDALTYHLRTPEQALATGGWQPDAFNVPTFFPSAHGTLYALTLVGDPEGVAAQLLSWAFHAAAVLAIARTAAVLGGAAAGRTGAALYAAVPAAGIVASFSWADSPLVFALSAAVLSLARGAPGASFALLGLSAAIKYTGLLYAIPVGLAAAVIAVRGRTHRTATLGILLGLGIAAPWYAANAVATGNPVYPFLHRIFPGPAGMAERVVQWDSQAARGPLPGWLSSFWTASTIDADLGGPLLLAILAGGWVTAVSTRRLRVPALLVAAPAVLLATSSPASRVLLPLVAGFVVVAAAAVVPSAERSHAGRAALAAVVALVGLRGAFLVAGHASMFFAPLPAAVGLVPESAWLLRNFPQLPLYRRAADLPSSARCLSIGEPRLFRFPRAGSSGTWADDLRPLAELLLPGRDAAAHAAAVRAAGYTHLLVTDAALRLARGAGAMKVGVPSGALDALLAACTRVDSEGGLALYALPPAARTGAPPAAGAPRAMPGEAAAIKGPAGS